MEFSDIHEKNQCDTSSINTTVLYENTGVRSVKQNESQKVGEIEKDEGHYEQLRLDSKPVENKGISQEAALNRLKLVVYIMSALVLVLFIAVIVLIIVIVVPKGQVAGKWAQWSDWTSCDVTCGNGTHTRTRTCTNPAPAHGGAGCTGESTENKKCSEHFCPVTDGGWTNWGTWSTCTVTCGGGMQARTRTCTNPKPSDQGEYCTGDPLHTQSCSLEKCSLTVSAFSVDKPHNRSNFDGISRLTFSHIIYQHGKDFDLLSGTYNCSIPGTYHFAATLVKKRSPSRVDRVFCYLYKNRFSLIYIYIDPTDDDTDKGSAAISQSVVINLDKGDNVYLGGCTDPSSSMEYWSSFTGFLLYPGD